MRDKIIEYIEDEKRMLDMGETSEIRLKGVSPSMIEEVFGDFDCDSLDFNGWQGDYWGNVGNYQVFGTMYYGTAEIRFKEQE